MLDFNHPEYLDFLWGIPLIFLIYGIIRYFRFRRLRKQGATIFRDPDEARFTISNGWFICACFNLVLAIVIIGFASPQESEESGRVYDSKEIQLMLAFDNTGKVEDGNTYTENTRRRMVSELDTLHFDKMKVKIGAVSSKASVFHTLDDEFTDVGDFMEKISSDSLEENFIARTISECTFHVKWNTGRMKNAIVIMTDRENMTREEIDAAKQSAKAAVKRHIFTYIIGAGPHADRPDLQEIANAGKGAYIEDEDGAASIASIVNTVKKNHRFTFIDVVNYVMLVVFFLLTPALVIYLCKRYSWLDKLGPIMVLYGVGLLLGSVKINGASLFPNEIGLMQNILSTAMVPLAIPLMLYSCTFNRNEIGKHFKAMITGLVGVVGAVVFGYWLCHDHVPEANKIAGMLTGVYTGGTINMAAIKESLQADTQTYILIQTYDIVICLAYLVFLLLGGFKLFRKWLNYNASQTFKKASKKHKLTAEEQIKQQKLEEDLRFEEMGFESIFTKEGFKNTLYLIGVTLGIVALSAGLTLLVSGGQLNMTIFFLLITTFGILASYIKKVHEKKQHYNIGLYFIYIFSLVLATMADFDSLKESLTTDFWLPSFVFIAVFGSLLLSAILGKIFRVDADTMVITSVTYINSPAFVPMIAAAMRNRNVLIPGLTIGVIGFAIGNYLGTFLAYILP